MSAKTIQIKELKALDISEDIDVRNKFQYTFIPDTDTLQGQEIPAWQNVLDVVNSQYVPPSLPINVPINTQLTLINDTYFYVINASIFSTYGLYPSVLVLQGGVKSIWVDYEIRQTDIDVPGGLSIPLPDIDDTGKTILNYTLVIKI